MNSHNPIYFEILLLIIMKNSFDCKKKPQQVIVGVSHNYFEKILEFQSNS